MVMVRLCNSIWIVSAIYGLNGVYALNSSVVVDLGYAKYLGVRNTTTSIDSWYGLPYAQPPVGPLRWQAPQTLDTSRFPSMTINATQEAPICVQGIPPWLPQGIPGNYSEDCLILDVKVPSNPVSSSLPVMVQIHGGGYNGGSSELIAPGDSLVYQSRGTMIYVSIQYRLGAYGFLGGGEIMTNGAANVGLLDQRAALEWVQRYIHYFGGDPAKVTIIGGSAGGGDVTAQMILYGGVSNPPFRAAIAEYPWWQPLHDQAVLQKQYNLLLNATGCLDLECLRRVPESTLMKATNETYYLGYAAGYYGFGDFFYGPYVDGSIIRDLPSEEFKNGHFTKVPLMTNREGYEGVLFSNTTQTTVAQETQDLQTLFPAAKPSFFTRLYELYPASDFNSTFFQRQQIFGDFIINCPTYYISTAVSDWGNPVYKMIFYAGSELHGGLIPFLQSKDVNGTSNNATLADVLRSYYVSFANTLDPNGALYTDVAHPRWPVYQSSNASAFSVLSVTYMTIGAGIDLDASARCDFFHGHSQVVRN